MKKVIYVLVVVLLCAGGYYGYSRITTSRRLERERLSFQRMTDPASLPVVRIESEFRATIAQAVPGEFTWAVDVPEDGRLQFSLAADPTGFARGSEAAIRQTVLLDGKSIFEYVASTERGWRDFEVDLRAYAGRRVSLLFRSAPKRKDQPLPTALWGNPTITAPRASHRLNVLIISIDALRADHLGCYGYRRDTSPVIDRLAQEGTRFANVYTTQSSTWPALTSMMTSQHPSTHGVTWNGYMLRPGVISLAEIFSSQGYSTRAFLANMGRGTHRGFDSRLNSGDRWVAKELIGALLADRNKPFFHWIHFIGPHDSYAPPEPYGSFFGTVADPSVGRHNRLAQFSLEGTPPAPDQMADIMRLYDGEIRAVDELVGKIMDKVRDLGLAENTVVVVTADHGEELFDRNNYTFHSGTVDDSTLHIPLIFWGASGMAKGTVDEIPASIVDVAPTLLQRAGLPVPSAFQGHSLLLPADKRPQEVLSVTWEEIFTLADGRYRYVYNPQRIHPKTEAGGYRFVIDAEELYSWQHDPRENILTSDRAIADGMKVRLLDWKSRVVKGPIERQTIDEETQKELQALGYVQQ